MQPHEHEKPLNPQRETPTPRMKLKAAELQDASGFLIPVRSEEQHSEDLVGFVVLCGALGFKARGLGHRAWGAGLGFKI